MDAYKTLQTSSKYQLTQFMCSEKLPVMLLKFYTDDLYKKGNKYIFNGTMKVCTKVLASTIPNSCIDISSSYPCYLNLVNIQG
jgi:hypothetical protein